MSNEKNARETIKQTVSNQIEQIKSEQTPSKILYIEKSYLNNLLPTPLLSNPPGKCTTHQSLMD